MNLINSSHEIRPLLVMQVPNEKGTMMNFVSAGIPMFAVSRNFTLTKDDFAGIKQLKHLLNVSYLVKYFPDVASYMNECIHKASGQRNILHYLRSAQNFESILIGICSMHGVDRETGCDIFVGEFLQTWVSLLDESQAGYKSFERFTREQELELSAQVARMDDGTDLLQGASDKSWARFEAEMKKIKNSQTLFRGRRSVKSFCDKLDKAREILADLSHESRMPHTLSDSERRLLDSTVSLLKILSGDTRYWADRKWPNNQAKDN